MVKTVEVGIQFVDIGNSINQIAQKISKISIGKGLSQPLLEDIKQVAKATDQYQQKIKDLKPKDMKIVDLQKVKDEGETLKATLMAVLKSLEGEFKKTRLTEAQTQELKKYSGQIAASRDEINKYNQILKDTKKTSSTFILPPIFKTGTTNIDTLRSATEKFREELRLLESKNNSPQGLNEDEKARYEMLQKGIAAADAEIQKQNELKRVTEEKIVAIQNEIAIKKQLIDDIEAKGKAASDEDIRQAQVLKVQIDQLNHSLEGQQKAIDNASNAQRKFNIVGEETRKSLGNMVTRFFSVQAIIASLRRVINQGIQAVKELDTSFTEIAMVTSYTNNEVWKMKSSFLELAKITGLTVTEVSKLSVEFFRQGRSLSETIKLVEAAGIAAKLAGISTGDSVRYLTSAINGYQLAANQAMVVSDKFAALAAASATDYEELATALSKVSSQAYAAGVGMDNMLGFIAKALEVTREAPENIGTAFKTIFARMQEIKDYGATLEDGMDVNRVDKALSIVNVSLRDQSGELRNLDDVLIDVGQKWKGLDKNQKAYITTALAGTRQQTRLLAVFEDFDRTMELTKVSSDSLGASYAQQEKYYNSIEYAITQLKTSWQDFITNIVSSELVIFLTNILNGFVNILNFISGNLLGQATLIIGGLTYAVIALREAMAMEGFQKFIASIKAWTTVNKAATGEIIKNTIAQEINTLAKTYSITASKTATAAEKAEALATQQATKSLLMKAAAWAVANPLAAAAIVITTALVGAFTAFAITSHKANGNIENLEKTTRKYNATIYDTNKKVNDVKSLIYKYEELAKQVSKTAEEEAQMAEYAEQIQDLLGEDYSVIDFAGNLDLEGVQEAIEKLTSESETEFNKLVKNVRDGLKRMTYSFDDLDFASKVALNLSDAIKAAGKENREEFYKLEKETQDYWLAVANAQNKALSTKVEETGNKGLYGTTNNFGTGQGLGEKFGLVNDIKIKIVPELNQEEIDNLNNQITEQVFSDWANSNAYDKAQMMIDLGYDQMSEAEKNYVNNMLTGAAAINKINELYADDVQTRDSLLQSLGTNIEYYDELMTKMDDLGIIGDTQKTVIADIVSSGAATAFNNFLKTSEATSKTFEELLSLATTFNELEFANVDTISSLGNLKGMVTSLEKMQKMLSGDEEFDLKTLQELVQTYPEIAQYIANNGQLTKEEINAAIELQNDAAKNDLLNQNIQYENQIKILKAKYDSYSKLAQDELYLKQFSVEEIADLEAAGLEAMLKDYILYEKSKTDVSIKYGEARINAEKAVASGEYSSMASALEAEYAKLDIDTGFSIPSLQGSVGINGNEIGTAQEYIANQMAKIDQQIKQYEALIKINELAISRIDNKTLFRDAESAAEEYAAQLNEIYILEQQIDALQSELDEYSYMEENAKTGEEYVTAIAAQNKILESQLILTNQLIDAQKSQQDSLYSNLGSLQSSVTLINGRLVPVMSKYVNLSAESQELIDETVSSYNDLSEGISENTMTVKENTQAIEDNLQKLEDKTVELYDILADAIRNSEQEKLDILKEGLEQERRLLDERRKMYEDAFAEEDFTNTLADTDAQRASIIEQLASLEGATDLSSAEKRKTLLEEKADLDREYNETLLDYNRDALFERLDQEEEYIDDLEEKYDASFEERVNSVEWMEAEIQRIMKEGRDYTIQYLKDHSTDFSDAWSISKDNIEGMWINLYDTVTLKLEDVASAIPDFSAMLEQLRQAVSYVAKLQVPNPTTPNPDPNKDIKTVWVYNGTEYDSKAKADAARDSAIKTLVASWGDEPYMNTLRRNQLTSAQTPVTSKVISAKTGGLVDYTGLAMLHGTSSKPERVLSPVQTELFDNMVKALESLSIGTNTNNESINIENITIQTPQLNSNLDFAAAGNSLASELAKAINERGISINKKR